MSKTTNKFFTEVRTRAVRMVLEHSGEASVALGGHGLNFPEDRLFGPYLHYWVKKAEVDGGTSCFPSE